MTNEEKAKEIADGYSTDSQGMMPIRMVKQEIKQSCLEMARWKDEQFDKKLQEIVDYVYPRILGGERLHINEIIGRDMVWKH